MQQHNYLFIDRDGTLIVEPEDKQVDSIDKLELMPGVIKALTDLQQAGFKLVMISNQDGLGTDSFPVETFNPAHEFMLRIFASQGIHFDDILICPHTLEDLCDCRKPKVGLLMDYLNAQTINKAHSYIIGDRETDMQLAKNLALTGLRYGCAPTLTWQAISTALLTQPRIAHQHRVTHETDVDIAVNLDESAPLTINTGIGFLDHMLEQLAKHGGFSLTVTTTGDLHIDDHHSVEDIALTLGKAMAQALGDKRGIGRYGFVLPMDESEAQVTLDLSGRPFFQFEGTFPREHVGALSTELVPHFFHSFAQNLKATLHIKVTGENTHHMIEAIFKSVGRTLRQAITKVDMELPTTKGVL